MAKPLFGEWEDGSDPGNLDKDPHKSSPQENRRTNVCFAVCLSPDV